jgi:chemotaxis methyl-accepting protein methylase/PAS domain-containing protein
VPKRSRSPAPRLRKAAPETPANTFPIVGVGASAGGLEAFRSFLKALPPDTGMAYVLVQHLHPRHESILADLLARSTRMPVSEVKRDVRVEPDRVYIIPPPHDIEIRDSRLKLVPRRGTGSAHMPIDRFLRTLAEVQKTRAIGVILSGTASDGTLGLKAVKARGGISFAQTPESAQYDGMPRSAIATGCVDRVLPPEDIARELARLGRHPYVADRAPAAQWTQTEAFSGILGSVKKVTGTDFGAYRRAALEKRIARRMALRRMRTLEDYAHRLEEDPEEASALYGDWLAAFSSSSFFRHPEALRAAAEDLLPRGAREKAPGEAVRVWVPGCATGEEVYSLAIVLLERTDALGISARFQIFATDINALALQTARAGVYLDSIAQDVSSERLARFFDKVDGHYKVTARARDLCIFARHDLLADPPYSRIDFVSCGDVLQPLEPVALEKALAALHYALQPDGLLMVAPSGSLEGTGLFTPRDPSHGLYSRAAFALRAVAPRGGLAAGSGAARGGSDFGKDAHIASLETQLEEARDTLNTLLTEYDSASQALQSSNEETLAANEELHNINEELQAAREQVQSANEELATLNTELHDRNQELGQTTEDLVGLLASLEIPIVVMGRDLVLRRFTPAAQSLLNFIPKDVGRPLGDIRTPFDAQDLPGQVREAMEASRPVDRVVSDARGRPYALRIRPHRTSDGRIDGAVMILLDVEALTAS